MTATILTGDCIEHMRTLPAASVQCCVTSPPYYGLRDYGVAGQIGLEATPAEFVARLVDVFREVRRVLKADGVAWVNMGDSYVSVGGGGADRGEMATRRVAQVRDRKAVHNTAERPPGVAGIAPKNLLGVPWRLAFALQADGWWLRQDIIWHKRNPMPESIKDRCTKAHEYVFLLSKSERYYYDAEAISEAAERPEGPGNVKPQAIPNQRDGENANIVGSLHKIGPRDTRNRRSVWTMASEPYPEAHFATFPTELPRLCILAGSRPGDTILDPFNGSGTTGQVALELGRAYIGCELNPEYVALTHKRLAGITPGLHLEAAA